MKTILHIITIAFLFSYGINHVQALTCEDVYQNKDCILLVKAVDGPYYCHKPGQGGLVGWGEYELHGYNYSCDTFSYELLNSVTCQYPDSMYRIHYYKFYWDGSKWVYLSNQGLHATTLSMAAKAEGEFVVYGDMPNLDTYFSKRLY